VIVESEWGFQNISNKDFACTLDVPASSLRFENTAGDWMTINSITIRQGDNETTLVLSDNSWGSVQDTYLFQNGTLKTVDGEDLLPFETYQANIDVAAENDIAFMVQEFGVYNETPYDVTIGFLSDLMDFFRDNGIGWAMWNFDGPFGILNSGRDDCPYESFYGNQLDSGMLDILAPEEVSGIQPAAGTGDLHIYPTPASERIHVSTDENTGRSHFEILDMTGRVMKSFYHDSRQQQSFDIDVSRLTAGAYILSMRNRSGRNWGRFLVE